MSYEAPAEIIEPYEPNVTALLDPGTLKWRHLVSADTPLATSWPKQRYDEQARKYQAERVELRKNERPESEMNALFRANQKNLEKMFSKSEHQHTVGAFEGANYESEGMFRSQMNCLMFTRSTDFCAVCNEAIGVIIDQYTR